MANDEKSKKMRRVVALVLWAGVVFFAAYVLTGHAVVSRAYEGKSLALLNRVIAHQDEHPLSFYIRKMDFLVIFAANFWLTALLLLSRLLHRPSSRERKILDAIVFVEYACLFFVYLANTGNQYSWYAFSDIMSFTGYPPYQHRVLFVVPAQVLRALIPSMSHLQAFLWSQLLAIVLALWAVKRFVALFIREDLAFASQFLVLAMWAPTLEYFTFYDIGIFFIYSFCLYHLFRREFVPYLLMLMLGTFNHEITLFLIVASAFVFFGRMELRKLAGFLFIQLALYVLVRACLFYFLPADRAWSHGRMLMNVHLIFEQPRIIFKSLAPLAVWFTLGSFGLRYAKPYLGRCLIVLPCLLAMTFLVGQLNEARQFDAFMPITAALILCWVAVRAGVPPEDKAKT